MSFIYSESSDVAFSIFNKQQVIHILLAAFFAQACPREVATVVGQLHVYWYFHLPSVLVLMSIVSACFTSLKRVGNGSVL